MKKIERASLALVWILLAGACQDDAARTDAAVVNVRPDSAVSVEEERAVPDGEDPSGASSDARAATADSLRLALERMARGAVPDSMTWFSARTADIIRGVEVDSAGHAVVDFHDLRPVIPNASSSAGSEMLLRELNAAVFGVGGVETVEYRMNGSCELLGEWLQYGVCLRFDPDGPIP